MPAEPLANWNGQEMPLADVRVSVLDRAFLFGDAVYEAIRVYNGRPFLFDDHIQRLQRNLEKMQLAADSRRIATRILQTLQHSGVQTGLIYIQVTRGEAPRTHHFPDRAVRPNELIYIKHMDDPYQRQRREGAKVILIDDLRWKRCDIKSVNLLANCLGAEEAHSRGCDEAIFVESNGTLIEGTHTSLFAVRDGCILTAPLGSNILPGITRKLVLRLAENCGIPVREQGLHRDDLSEIDELFLTGTSTEVLPVVRVDETPIGNGAPGPVVAALQEAYREAIANEPDPSTGSA
ncbi:D-amino acid aminotransferase [Planctomicrobium sp. SH661]|uniref:D-amino acid aminotransferase n=1 Tax=Planctomicrobium sp. SH661 TaxID=3448124 RepID=UPI003F5CB2DC